MIHSHFAKMLVNFYEVIVVFSIFLFTFAAEILKQHNNRANEKEFFTSNDTRGRLRPVL